MERIKELVSKFTPYLEDIRIRLYKTTIIFAVTFFVGFSCSGPILRLLLRIFKMNNVVVAATSPFQLANLSMDIGLFCAFSISIPVLLYHFFAFSSKALSQKEKRKLLMYVPVSVLLFMLGFAYAFFILYYSFSLLSVFGQSIGLQNIWDIGLFVSQTYMTALLLGFIFQMPLVLTILMRLGAMDVTFLKEKRRVAYVIVVILVSLLPPTDGLSLMVMSLPLILLYEGSIFINRNIKKHV
ncbi:MAG: twin-arginine translocase subunit TatC [Candidatus Pacebacteria bacterium]|nr:twin-arginine translocase subunit TatC [Candidatus Paceibacterota bacterium]